MNNINMTSFGETLKFFRKQQGMTQKQLAAKIGVHVNTIWAWERGDYLPQTKGFILEIANQLGLSDFETHQLLEASLMYSPSLPHWNVPYPRNPFFVGRKDVLHHLYQAFQEQRRENHAASYAISGMGGIGKTQTALEYTYLYYQDYAAVFWVNAKTRESIIASFVSIAKVLSLPQFPEANAITVIADVIEWLNAHSDWLLVIDDVEDLEMVKSSLPAARQGTFLFTTRLYTLGTLASIIVLEPLSLQEGAHLLLNRTQHLDKKQASKHLFPEVETFAQTLAKVMGGLPLALDQAEAYMEQTHCTLKEFLHLFNAYPVQLLSERDAHADHPFSVVKTFVETFEQLQQEHAVAAQLLTLCCFLAPDEIPEVLFEHVHVHDRELLLLKEAVSHPLYMNAIFKDLLAYSLICRHAYNQTISVHRLVQVVLKERLPEVEQREWNERVVHLLNQVIQLDFNQARVEQQPLYELILPHALQCAQQATHLHAESSDLGYLLFKVATYLFQRSRFQEAEPLYQQAISILQRHLEPTHVDLVLALTRLGNIRHQLNRFQKAGVSCECAACC